MSGSVLFCAYFPHIYYLVPLPQVILTNQHAGLCLVQPAGKSLFHLKYPILLDLNLSYVISLGAGKETFRLS